MAASFFSESFETDGNGTRYSTNPAEFSDGSGDFFTRTDGSNIGSFYNVSGIDGSYFFAAMDTNGEAPFVSTTTLLFEDIDIGGRSNLTFDALFAEDDDGTNQDWDADALVYVEASIDGGAYSKILQFASQGSTNSEPGVDSDFDGVRDGDALTSTFANFSAAISGTGTSLDLRVTFENLEAGDEDVALDNIRLSEAGPLVPVINEFVANHTGSDAYEFIEIFADPNTDLSGLSVLAIEGDSAAPGVIDGVFAVGTTDANGFWTTGFQSNALENGTQTLLLVDGFTGAQGDDLDTDDDGTLDVTPFTSIIDSVAVLDGGASDQTYSPVVLDEAFDDAGYTSSFAPGGASRLPNGTDTDSTSDWVRNDFDGAGIAALNPGSEELGEALNTMGAANAATNPPTATAKTIMEIQGNGAASPFDGVEIITSGIVIGDFQDGGIGSDGDLNGFYIQDAAGDGDAATSDGIFVYDGFTPTIDVAVGDFVEITATVDEYFGLTELTSVSSVNIISNGNPVPSATVIDLPSVGTFANSDGKLIADLEAFEGMLVSFPDTLSVTELYQLDRFGEMVLSEGGRLFQFTSENAPDVAGYNAHLEDIASRTIRLDDGLTVQNPDPIRYPSPGLDASNTVRMGDTVDDLTGVLHFSRGSGGSGDEDYRLMPTVEPVFTEVNSREPLPADVGGTLKVASFNVLNFFNGDGMGGGFPTPRGADNATEFARQTQKLVTALMDLDADIIGLNEIENDGFGSESAIQELVDELNAAIGVIGAYDFADPGLASVGTDAIATGFIFDTRTVEIAAGTTVEVLDDVTAGGLGFTTPLFDGVNTNRNPMAATFEELASGERLTVAVNHLKSKGGSGAGLDADAGDGAGNYNETRLQGAMALDAWLDTDPTGSSDADVLIIGDLNSYAQEDPVQFLNGEYTNLFDTFGITEPYSFVFDGQAGALDYGLASTSLVPFVTGVAEWHINADEPDGLDYNTDFGRNTTIFDGTDPFRASDHDPLVIGLNLAGKGNSKGITESAGSGDDVLIGTPFADQLTGNAGDDQIEGRDDDDVLAGGSGNDIILGEAGNDTLIGGPGDDDLQGGIGDDELSGGEGHDQMAGGDGADLLNGGTGNNVLSGNAGDDTLIGVADVQTFDGGDGSDFAQMSWAGSAAPLGFAYDEVAGFAFATDGSLFTSIEQFSLFLGTGDDNVTLGSGDDRIQANAGNDVLHGGGGDDLLLGEAGADRLFGDAGADLILGGDDNDIIQGGAGNDTLLGHAGNDRLYGDSGVDRLFGGDGSDLLVAGDDGAALVGGLGNDRFFGGSSADIFYALDNEGADRVFNFTAGVDKVNVANTGLADFADVQANLANASSGVLLQLGTGYLQFQGLLDTDLSAGDFIFA